MSGLQQSKSLTSLHCSAAVDQARQGPRTSRGRGGQGVCTEDFKQLKRQVASVNWRFIHGKPAFTLKKIPATISAVLEFSSA
jgi:hypothetical protein